ncbi:PREDICTED: uncharacterized protein LOC108771633 [Cyphomyrmex costatus]|uniref:Uncharacterized protein n=1 Tax=Cyphomyrmex costatus TaxID=456900 RepID=A0A195CXN7_9HYME|nr:PREDICTED: uncharacterized protein LOC108771633 [Cyphomyrmex costatus]KYN05342.1 hypothetical protein ALC62_03626 [Cyphomyrmex costatus]
MGFSFISLVVVAVVSIITGSFECFGKRSMMGDDTTNIDYPDYSPKNEDYLVVPKRAALLFDRLMVALQNVVDNRGKGSVGSKNSIGSNSLSRNKVSIGSTGISEPPEHHFQAINSEIIPIVDDETVANSMDLQRRGLVQSKLFWHCYFNTLACFKKK